MPKVSGQDIISQSTETTFRALVIFSGATILTKAYGVPLDDVSILGVKMPASIFDVALLVIVLVLLYTYLIKWVGDLAAFRLWYRESWIWSMFQTRMKLDRSFIKGGVRLLIDLHELERSSMIPTHFDQLTPEMKQQYDDFRTNVELWGTRLGAAGTKFSALSAFGHFYVWVQHFVFPVGLALYAFYLLAKYGTFAPPIQT